MSDEIEKFYTRPGKPPSAKARPGQERAGDLERSNYQRDKYGRSRLMTHLSRGGDQHGLQEFHRDQANHAHYNAVDYAEAVRRLRAAGNHKGANAAAALAVYHERIHRSHAERAGEGYTRPAANHRENVVRSIVRQHRVR